MRSYLPVSSSSPHDSLFLCDSLSPQVVEALVRSFEMHQTERTARFRRNLEFCSRMTTLKWAENVLKDLKNVELCDLSSTLGIGGNFRMVGMRADLFPLEPGTVLKAYRASQYRLLLFDWGGTLTDTLDNYEAYAIATGNTSRTGPSKELIEILQALCDDPRNYCFVISGRAIHSMREFFGSIDRLGLAAEHGCYYRMPSKERTGTTTAAWTTSIALESTEWMDPVRRIMDIYTQRTHGSYIEQKGAAMIWQFRDADPDFGYIQSKELEEHLYDILSSYPLEIIRGGGVSDGYLEIRPAGLSKGLFLSHITAVLKSKGILIDFLLAIGDDITDEPMFEAANRLQSSKKVSFFSSPIKGGGSVTTPTPITPTASNKLEVFTVSVGKRVTVANAYVNDSSEVLDLMRALNKTRHSDKKYMSAVDLSAHHRDQLSSFFGHAATLTPTPRSPMPRSNSDSQLTALVSAA
jgi:trehalose 6-phosphate synthase/phosphatase